MATDLMIGNLVESMRCYIGQTVTIFTTSGGLSGAGFTGVLVAVDCNVARLLVEMGAPPSCPVGSACTGPMGGPYGGYCGINPLGAICEIPNSATKYTHLVRKAHLKIFSTQNSHAAIWEATS